ncbi:MAG: PCMD domain-containing protein [Bacteroidaceae bacterium]|nr:PCMD domain-containing protein [Bacteroidaceae bacterium]MBR1789281.1 PCMD domain-containing protein [Bacteroidaceae bacterium]
MKVQKIIVTTLAALASYNVQAQEELIKYGDFETWVNRTIKESRIIGGKTKKLVEVGPAMEYTANAYKNQGGSPWATSNVYAHVSGISKTNSSVYKDKHGSGTCAKLRTHIEGVKVLGIINIHVLAAGSLYLGEMVEPIKSSKNPMSKMNIGIPFTRRPKALKFDYKVQLSDSANVRMTGFSSKKTMNIKDYCDAVCILQKRWEDEDGNIHALRVGTMVHKFTKSTPSWQEGKTFEIHYGDITGQRFFRKYMGLITGDVSYYATNSKGKQVKILEEGWADADEAPTHLIVKFDSSDGGAYIGSPGNTLWVDNVKLVY